MMAKQTKSKTKTKKKPDASTDRRRKGEQVAKRDSAKTERSPTKPEDELARIWDEDLCE